MRVRLLRKEHAEQAVEDSRLSKFLPRPLFFHFLAIQQLVVRDRASPSRRKLVLFSYISVCHGLSYLQESIQGADNLFKNC
jgi:hypothetical protein